MPCPTLQRLCLEVLAWSSLPFWQLQKRKMQFLPEHAANTLMQLLLQLHKLHAPSQLDAFKDCLTELHISADSGTIQLDSEWLAHICSCRQLRSLSLTDLPRLRDKSLGSLTALAAGLQHLDLTGCSGLTSRSLHVLGQLTSLHSLVLTGTSIKPPLLAQLTALQHLTRLHVGGCDVTDADITQHLAVFSALGDLDLWGCTAGDAAARHICQSLPRLQQLSMAWSKVATALPLLPGLTHLDLSHCVLRGPCSDADLVAAADMQQLRVLVLVQAEVDTEGCEVLSVLLRASAERLQVLDLTGAALDNLLSLLLALEGAAQLAALSLSGTHLSDDFLPALAACTSLHTLNLSLNPSITEAGLSATLPAFAAHLQRLDLAKTGVRNAVLPLLKHLPRLQQLVLADTGISWESKAQEETAGQAGAGAGMAAAQAIPAAGGQQQQLSMAAALQQEQVASRAAAKGGASAAGWAQLQLLDVSGTQLTEAGCVQLAAEMRAAAAVVAAADMDTPLADAAGHTWCSSSKEGLQAPGGMRVLLVGSGGSCKLGRKALTALGQINTLQQLKLQGGWEVNDRDMRHLHALQQLQQLHVAAVDPWLLSDAALLHLQEELPELYLISRDGRQLLHLGHRAALINLDNMSSGSNSSNRISSAPDCAGVQGGHASAGVNNSNSVATRSIWPAGPAEGDGSQSPGVTVPWLHPSVAQQGTPALHSPVQKPAGAASGSRPPVKKASSAAGSAGQLQQGRVARQTAGSPRGSQAGSSTVYQRLSAYDERYRYSMQQLLELQAHQAATQHAAGEAQQQQQESCAASINDLLPEEIRVGTKW